MTDILIDERVIGSIMIIVGWVYMNFADAEDRRMIGGFLLFVLGFLLAWGWQ